MRNLPLFVIASTVIGLASIHSSPLNAQGRSLMYPFDVEIAGEPAVPPAGAMSTFATAPRPIAADARVELDTEGEQIIVNIFPIDDKGAPVPGVQAKAIIVDHGTGFDLDATMDKSTLEPGRYGMNILLASKGTSRVQFTVGTPEQVAAASTTMPEDGKPKSKDFGKTSKMKPKARAGAAVGSIIGLQPSRAEIGPGPKLNMAGADLLGPAPSSAPETTVAPTADKTTESDQSTPEGTLRKLFALVGEGKFEQLKALAAADCDGDVRDLCGVADAPADAQAEVKDYFANGKVVGEARIEGNTAEVDFLFGPGGERKETMELERTGPLWFLKQF